MKMLPLQHWLLSFFFLISLSIEAKTAPSLNLAVDHEEVFVENQESELFCRVMGQGKPLLFIHGGPGLSQDYLLPSLSRLGKNNRVIFYDQRGCGNSTCEISSETISLKTFLEDIEAIRKELGYEKISLAGHSWGGLLAMHYAIEHPESVEKLILFNSSPGDSQGFSLFIKEWLRRTAFFQDHLRLIENTGKFAKGDPDMTAHYHRTIFKTFCYDPPKANQLQLAMSKKAALNGQKTYEILRQHVLIKPYNLHSELEKLKIPTLIIHGETDPIPSECAEKLHASIPGSQFVLLQNCGHFPFIERPVEFFRVVETFLQEE